ncbi:unnamed protein product [Symbiodinium natans]|uniref:Uncharacterized protein n=1 Tax=Symbiodinium natans TaxID=878477 RepID=A0A812NWM8_9DINO|nr:unnamed protein product [Symbiodinium natans]
MLVQAREKEGEERHSQVRGYTQGPKAVTQHHGQLVCFGLPRPQDQDQKLGGSDSSLHFGGCVHELVQALSIHLTDASVFTRDNEESFMQIQEVVVSADPVERQQKFQADQRFHHFLCKAFGKAFACFRDETGTSGDRR